MPIQSLGYMEIGSDNLESWDDLATRLLGMQRVDRGGGMRAFRMDDRTQRQLVSTSVAPATIGWEVADAAALDDLGARLDAGGVPVAWGTRSLTGERQVTDLITFSDP